ncbi:MAG: hypothetical protein ACFHHU_18355 [Porticoccaceae bacterium]
MLRSAGKNKNNKDKGRNVLLHQCATATLLFGLGAAVGASDLRANELVPPAFEIAQQENDNQDKFLILQTNLHPPYQELQNGLLGGYSISVLNCAFERIGVGYGLAVAPRQRNRDMVRSGRADGFFLARISDFMDEYAVATHPLALEKWVWVSPSSNVVSSKARHLPKPGEFTTIGAILGSNEAEWLSEQGYEDVMRVPSIASLVSQVAAGRVDFALVDKQSFEIARNDLGLGAEQFLVQFERYAPLVVYFSKRYVETYPDLLGKLNNVLEFCETRPMHLEPWERDAIERIQLPIVRQFAKSKDLIRNVRAVLGTEHIPSDQKRVIDEEWTALSRRGLASSMAQNILDNILSDYLQTFKNTAGAQVAEVFVFDLAGQVIGMNRLTSDFDQSDEVQYQMTDSINRDHALIADIRYDASTRTFLSQITVPIIDPESGRTLAALTVGLDVSAALRPES